ncbi:MAG TPA: LLM class flavin-dependent oxidoreductase [Acidimicrobiales bacterium]|nr:LLM class flavin-dependent oxidoreductase [Acidimicrobiales bacterium]
MKIGITLPQFRDDAEPALEAAVLAQSAGLDGVFVFDHLWPIGRPDRPALHGPTLLGAIAAATSKVAVGTLVARVGLVPDAVLVHQFATVRRIAGPRLIAGLGIGDHLSRPENEAYGVPLRPVAERRAQMASVCRSLRGLGVTVWVGGRAPATRAIGRTEAGAVNLWQATPDEVAAEVSRGDAEVTWGGQVDLSPGSGSGSGSGVTTLLSELAGAGAAWAVVAPVGVSWPAAIEALGAAAAVGS